MNSTNETKSIYSMYALTGFILLVSLCIQLTVENYLPVQFTRDNHYLIQRFDQYIENWGDDSFEKAVMFYNFLGIQNQYSLSKLFNFMLSSVTVLLLVYKLRFTLTTLRHIFPIGLYSLLVPFFMFGYSKETIICLGLLVTIAATFTNINPFIAFSAYLLLIGLTFRPYYLLILMSYWAFLLLTSYFRKRYGKTIWFSAVPITIILYTAFIASVSKSSDAFSTISGVDIFNIRMQTLSSTAFRANSAIQQSAIIDNNIFENAQNYILTWIQFIAPLKLLNGGLYGVFTFLLTVIMNILLYRAIYLGMNSENRLCFNIGNLIMALLSTFLVFQPDLGSYVKHTFVYLPLVVLLNIDRDIAKTNILSLKRTSH